MLPSAKTGGSSTAKHPLEESSNAYQPKGRAWWQYCLRNREGGELMDSVMNKQNGIWVQT